MPAESAAVFRPEYTPHARAERLIAGGRFALAFSSLIAIYIEPSTPARFREWTYGLLAVYTVYALFTAAFALRSGVPSPRYRLLSHAADLLLFTIFIYLTEGPASPFFIYFAYSLLCAMLRFSWRGILATGLAAMGIYGLMSGLAAWRQGDVEVSRIVIREAYLGVIAAMLVYLGVYQQRLRSELAALAAWPRTLSSRVDDVLRTTLEYGAAVLRTPRLLIVWEESEEPWIHVADWSQSTLREERIAPAELRPPGARELINTSFHFRGDSEPILVYRPERITVSEEYHDALDADFRQRFGFVTPVVVVLESEAIALCMVIPSERAATADELALAHITGRLVHASLEQFLFLQQVQFNASADERLRISRELHDGIVQSLGGVGLQLEAIRTQLDSSAEVSGRLAHVQRVIEHDQRELRNLVRELRPHDPRSGDAILREELERMKERFTLEWGLEVEVAAKELDGITGSLAHELARIVNESLANAARHSGASRARVDVTARAGVVDLSISDDGRGFPFLGRKDLAQLERAGMAPRSLKERVLSLGGSLTLESSRSGARVEVTLPVAREDR